MTATATTSKTDELLQRLTEGVQKLTSSDEWLAYLDVAKRLTQFLLPHGRRTAPAEEPPLLRYPPARFVSTR